MASAQFSEFSFGFAYTREIVNTCWTVLDGGPTLPSLYDEGKGGGFDVAVGLIGWTYFAQFKRSDFLSRSNATWWTDHGGSYYRFPITRERHSRQHELLLRLDLQSVFHIVEYVAPRFHTNAQLSANFLGTSIVGRSLRVFPHVIGQVVDDQQHYVTFTVGGAPVVRSDPFYVDQPYNAGDLTEWQPPSDETAAVALNAATFDEISERLLATARQVNVPMRGLSDGMTELSAFGRARTLGRLLAGGELIPIVRAQEHE